MAEFKKFVALFAFAKETLTDIPFLTEGLDI